MGSITNEMLERLSNHDLHVLLWTWLAENPNCLKGQWPEWWGNGGNVVEVGTLCFACEETKKYNHNDAVTCMCCPITWIYGDRGGCGCPGSAYNLWKKSSDIEIISKCAKQIADAAWHIYE